MRKTAVILLLMLLVFNTIGYKLWFNIAMEKADYNLEAALDKNNFSGQELFTLKVPINLPYQNIVTGFERIDGEIIINGETYKYVQRKVENDTMFLQCIRHTEKINLQQRSNDYFGKVNDVPGDNNAKKIPGKSNTLLKLFSPDFVNDITHWKCASFMSMPIAYSSKNSGCFPSPYLQKMLKPPREA